MTEEISLKVKILYVVLAVSLIVLVWTGDEGKQPIVYSGIDLQHSVGLIDSENFLSILNLSGTIRRIYRCLVVSDSGISRWTKSSGIAEGRRPCDRHEI